jgi:hypothetical protein
LIWADRLQGRLLQSEPHPIFGENPVVCMSHIQYLERARFSVGACPASDWVRLTQIDLWEKPLSQPHGIPMGIITNLLY